MRCKGGRAGWHDHTVGFGIPLVAIPTIQFIGKDIGGDDAADSQFQRFGTGTFPRDTARHSNTRSKIGKSGDPINARGRKGKGLGHSVLQWLGKTDISEIQPITQVNHRLSTTVIINDNNTSTIGDLGETQLI